LVSAKPFVFFLDEGGESAVVQLAHLGRSTDPHFANLAVLIKDFPDFLWVRPYSLLQSKACN
jgi:hypothetical protein